jgi:A/G-specific adenine glycosylase
MIRQPQQERITWFQQRVLGWYEQNGRTFWWRRKGVRSFDLVIAETLLQRTQADVVAKHIRRFLRYFGSWSTLAQSPLRKVQQAVRPLGLWRRRAITLRSLAWAVVQNHGRLPDNREMLEKMPGIGQYIASAILTYWHDQREPLIDVNMARVLERFFGPRKLADIRCDPYLQTLARQAVDPRRPREYNWAVLDFAALVCTTKKPKCHKCTLRNRCLFFSRVRKLGNPD